VAQTTSGNVPSEWVEYTLQAARLGLRNRTIFAPGDPGHTSDVLDIADLRGDGNGVSGVFSRYGTVTASTGAEGVEYSAWQAFDPSTTAIAITKQQAGIVLTKERLMKARTELGEWVKAGEELSRAMAQKVNVDVCSAFSSFSSSVGSTGTNITNANILTAVDTLQTAKAEGQLHCVLHTHQWYDLMTESNSPLADASKTALADKLYMQYFYDDIYGLRWFTTQDVQSANAGADWCGAMFSPEAIGLSWGQDFDLEVEWDKNSQVWELLMTAYWGVGIADTNCGLKLVTDY